MLKPDLFDAHVGARLLDFRTPWPRRLWSSGIVLTLKEILGTSEMVSQGVLYQPVLKDIASTAVELAGRDPGVGDSAAHKKLHELLKGDLKFGSADYLQLKELTTDIENDYLRRWAAARSASKVTPDPNLKPERTARAVCAHLLDAEFSSEFLFGWWRYRLERDPDPKDLHEFVEEANSLANESPKEYEVLLVFREAPPNKSLVPPTWMSPADVSAYVSANHDGARLRQVGGMWIRVSARDPRSGVQRAAEIVDRVASRVQVGTTGNLVPLPQVYVRGFKGSYPLRERRWRVEVH